MGRHTVLTPEVQEAIVTAILAGNYRDTAANAAGVGERTVREWVEKGLAGDERYVEFAAALKKAESDAEKALLAEVRAGGDGWQSKSWIMERRWPQRWGGRVRMTINDERESLLSKVAADPDLHRRLRDVLAGEGAAEAAPGAAAH